MFQKIKKSIKNVTKIQDTIRFGQLDKKQNQIKTVEMKKN